MWLEYGLPALLQLHLHSWLNTWIQWIWQKQVQDKTRNIQVWCVFSFFILSWNSYIIFCVLSLLWGICCFHSLVVGFHISPLCPQGVFSTIPGSDFQLLLTSICYLFLQSIFPLWFCIYLLLFQRQEALFQYIVLPLVLTLGSSIFSRSSNFTWYQSKQPDPTTC